MTTAAFPAETWDQIRCEWLPGGGDPPFAPEVIVAGFTAARRLLGPTWPEDVSQGARGPMPLRWVVAIGCRLEAVEHLPGAGRVIAKIVREGWVSSALAELAVGAALHAHWRDVELEPPGPHPPDARVLVEGRPVHIEVARPELSAPARLNRGVDWPVDGKESGFDNRLVGEESWPTSFRCGPQEAQMPPDRRPVAPAFRRPR